MATAADPTPNLNTPIKKANLELHLSQRENDQVDQRMSAVTDRLKDSNKNIIKYKCNGSEEVDAEIQH